MICARADEKNLDAIEKLIDKTIPRSDNPLQTTEVEADAPAKEEKPKRTRTRKPKAEKIEAEAIDKPAANTSEAPEEKKAQTNRNRSRGRDGNKTVGMGDHMPSFIAKSFEERKAS